MVIILWWHKVPSFLPLCVYHCLNTSILWTGQKRPRNQTGLGSRPTPQTGTDSLKQDTEKYCYCTVMYIRTIFTRVSTMGYLYQTPIWWQNLLMVNCQVIGYRYEYIQHNGTCPTSCKAVYCSRNSINSMQFILQNFRF